MSDYKSDLDRLDEAYRLQEDLERCEISLDATLKRVRLMEARQEETAAAIVDSLNVIDSLLRYSQQHALPKIETELAERTKERLRRAYVNIINLD
jgi:hypothetical protein